MTDYGEEGWKAVVWKGGPLAHKHQVAVLGFLFSCVSLFH